MAKTTLIKGGRIVNEGRCYEASILIEDQKIVDILEAPSSLHASPSTLHHEIDAAGCYVLPGVIDTHVHFREPGMTDKADLDSESCAAAAGGVTSFFDMPNTVPQTTTLEALEDKFQRAARSSHVNYTFFFGATNDNIELFKQLDVHRVPGIKLFMGSSTGNMLVDRDEALQRIFASAPLPIMAHCEDTAIINRNMEEAKKAWGDDPQVSLHALIRSEEACLASTMKAVQLAKKHGARLHVAHLSTAEELDLITENGPVTAEATVGHLYFTMLDHERLGARIKVNPAIKSPVDQFMLRQALNDGRITTIATDHAPHLLSQKEGGCAKAASGMPMVQFSLPTMLELVDQKVLTIERLVQLMCHQPAMLFEVQRRGFIRKGYQADLVRPKSPWTVTPNVIESKCKWSPMEGHTFNWKVEQTLCNGHLIYNKGVVDRSYIGQPLTFR